MSAVDALAGFKASIAPYLLWAKLIAVAVMLGLTFGAGWRVCDWRWESKENKELKALQDKIAASQAEWERERLRWEQASAMTASNLANLEAQKDTLMATLSGLKLTRTVVVKPNEQGMCESAVLDDSFRLRWNTVVRQAATGAAADRRK